MRGLKDKVAIVTGGGQGIGRALTLRLAEEGCKVAIFDLKLESAREAEKLAPEGRVTSYELDVGDYRTFLKLMPPLRTEDERMALVEAMSAGLIDIICSDHDPQDVETKRLPFAEAAAGAIGVETMLSAGLRLVAGGHVKLPRLIRAMTARPAEILKLPVGKLAPGVPAEPRHDYRRVVRGGNPTLALDLLTDSDRRYPVARHTPGEPACRSLPYLGVSARAVPSQRATMELR